MGEELAGLGVLIVDDDEHVRTFLAAVLDAAGAKDVERALDGGEALARLDERGDALHVVLCDLNMPGMDGPAFFRHLGERGSGADVVLVSGESQAVLRTSEDLARTHGLNVLGSLSKPIDPKALVELLANRDAMRPRTHPDAPESVTKDELRAGITEGRLALHYQPKIGVGDDRFVGVEALARWRHEKHGLLGPGLFLPTAEQSDLIHDLTDVVLVQALEQAAAWRAGGLDLTMAVNVSVRSLERVEFADRVMELASATSTAPTAIVLEVTETGLMENVAACLEVLTRLRMQGVGLAIDDFGTGYSSMMQLSRVPFTELKIDRVFVNGAARDHDPRAMLRSSVKLAHDLDLMVVAEGVETVEDWKLLEHLGVELAQGFLVARPMPAAEVSAWSKKWARSGSGSGSGSGSKDSR